MSLALDEIAYLIHQGDTQLIMTKSK